MGNRRGLDECGNVTPKEAKAYIRNAQVRAELRSEACRNEFTPNVHRLQEMTELTGFDGRPNITAEQGPTLS